jgi:hypothetical protein
MKISQKDYAILTDSIELRKKDNGNEYYCRKDNTPKYIETILTDTVFAIDQECHSLDLAYTILNDVINELAEIELKDLPEYDIYENQTEFASVYTATRLEYLNMWNNEEITQKVKECECDIQTACAIWYDEQVINGFNFIKDLITTS